MGAQNIQNKIDKAHKKVGLKLGYEYGIYRPLTNVDVLGDENWVDTVKAAFTLNDGYTTALNWSVPVWTCYSDAQQLQTGDFLYSEEQGRTFFVLTRQPHLPILALECPHTMNIQTVGYGDTGNGYEPGATTYIAKNLPGFVQYGATSKGGTYPGRTNTISGIRTATFITTLPNPEMLMGAVVSDEHGFSGNVVSYDYSAVGKSVKLIAQETDAP